MVHSSNEVIDYETYFGEWKIQLTMQIIFFFFSKDSGETRTMHNKSRSIEIMMGSEKTIILKNLVNLFDKIIKKDQKNQQEEASLLTIVLIYCIVIFRE